MGNRMVMVTGATGYIGRYVIKRLLDEGLKVLALTRADGNRLFFPGRTIEIITGDITKRVDIPPGVNSIYHCAGAITREDEMKQVNVAGTRNVVEAALAGNCRLIHLSSAGVVGRSKKETIDETTPCNPEGIYEKTKLEAEDIVMEGVRRGLTAQILRPTTVFGAGRAPEADSLLQFIRALYAGSYRHIHGGSGIYNIVYAGEVARAMFELDSSSVPKGGIFFINTPVSFSEFATIISNAVGKNDIKIANIPYAFASAAAVLFSLFHLLTGTKRGLTFSRLKALTEKRVFSQERLLSETAYRPLHNVGEYLEQLCEEYAREGLLNAHT